MRFVSRPALFCFVFSVSLHCALVRFSARSCQSVSKPTYTVTRLLVRSRPLASHLWFKQHPHFSFSRTACPVSCRFSHTCFSIKLVPVSVHCGSRPSRPPHSGSPGFTLYPTHPYLSLADRRVTATIAVISVHIHVKAASCTNPTSEKNELKVRKTMRRTANSTLKT